MSEKLQPGLDLTGESPRGLTVVPSAAYDVAALEARVRSLGGTVLARLGVRDGLPRLRVRLAGDAVVRLAGFPEVAWIERHVRRRLFNDVAVSNTLMNVEQARTEHGLTGRGQVITTSDSGIDTGDLETLHADLRPNLLGFSCVTSPQKNDEGEDVEILAQDVVGHGTHTAGSLVGTGACSAGRFKGVAYEAKLWAWFCLGEDGGVYTPGSFDELFRPTALGATNAYIHSASWGGDYDTYNTESQGIDAWCWNHPDLLPVFSAGNAGKDSAISSEGIAKNVLCVGATENYRPNKGGYSDNPDDLAYFSARGPTPDGRIKPDICAPGSFVISTRSSVCTRPGWGVYDENYLYNGGTSMSTPLVSGTVALIRQWLVEQGGFTNRPPSAALMKAVITGGATRLGTDVPNKDFGWGRVNLMDTLFPSDGRGVALEDYIPFSTGSVYSFDLTVTNTAPLDVQLCWIDPAADPRTASRKALVIDLDLVVSNRLTGVTYSPDDHVNNLESVHLDAATPGTYTVFVRGPSSSTRYSSTQGGAAAVYARGAFGETEYVTLTIAGEGGSDHNATPAVGAHTYVKGEMVTLRAGKSGVEGGADYHYSSAWGMDVARYPFLGWRAEGLPEATGTTDVVRVTLTNDVALTWRWADEPGEVCLMFRSFDDFNRRYLYAGATMGESRWVARGVPLVVSAAEAPLAQYYAATDAGRTVPINEMVYAYDGRRTSRRSYGVLRLTSFYVLDETGAGDYVWNAADNYRLPSSLTLPMDAFTAVDFSYADETAVHSASALPYWWWARNFQGARAHEAITEAASAATGDPDGDGFDNAAEYAEPTDPWSVDSFPFRFTEVTPTNLTFIGSVSGEFSLQHAVRLDGVWSNVWRTASSRGSVTNRVDFTKGADASGFYRLAR